MADIQSSARLMSYGRLVISGNSTAVWKTLMDLSLNLGPCGQPEMLGYGTSLTTQSTGSIECVAYGVPFGEQDIFYVYF